MTRESFVVTGAYLGTGSKMNPDRAIQECTRKLNKQHRPPGRVYPEELKKAAVQMLRDGHSTPRVAHQTIGQHFFG